MQNVGEQVTKATTLGMAGTAPASTIFGFTMTNNEWVDSFIGAVGAIAFIYFQYQTMKDRKEKLAWNKHTERRSQKKPRD